MLSNWKSIVEKALANIQEKLRRDERIAVNESELKVCLCEALHQQKTDVDDMFVKSEVPWYDQKFPPTHGPRFYFDISIFRDSSFKISMRDASMPGKGFRYNDISIAMMLKFVKREFNYASIADDLRKLKYFSDETSGEADKHKPVIIICATDSECYLRAEASILRTIEEYDAEFLSRLAIYLFSPQNEVQQLLSA